MPVEIVPPISALKANYPTPEKYDHAALYKEFGLPVPTGEEWENTCAVRMSYCLLKCDINLGMEPGRGKETEIRIGKYKGKHIWLSRKSLSARVEAVFGKPTYVGGAARKERETLVAKIGTTGGIISYGKLAAEGLNSAYPGGHIDVAYYYKSWWLFDSYAMMIGHDFDMMFRRAEEVKFWKSGG